MFVFLIVLIAGIVCGCISKSINESKGYEGGFAWGFFLSVIGIIVVAVKPFNQPVENETTLSYTPHIFWCTCCGSTYSSTGTDKRECPSCKGDLKETTVIATDWRTLSDEEKLQLKREFANGRYIRDRLSEINPKKNDERKMTVSVADELKKYKMLLDEGAITEDEYKKVKAKLLS